MIIRIVHLSWLPFFFVSVTGGSLSLYRIEITMPLSNTVMTNLPYIIR